MSKDIKNTCIKRLFGSNHKFKPRYERTAPDFLNRLTKIDSLHRIEDTYEETYVYDICVYCGKIIKG